MRDNRELGEFIILMFFLASLTILFIKWTGYDRGYRQGQADERQDCINAICLNSSYFENGEIINLYVNIDTEQEKCHVD